jgi:hypothetical protein
MMFVFDWPSLAPSPGNPGEGEAGASPKRGLDGAFAVPIKPSPQPSFGLPLVVLILLLRRTFSLIRAHPRNPRLKIFN